MWQGKKKLLGRMVAIVCLIAAAGCPGSSERGDKLVLRFSFGGSFKDLEFWKAVCQEFEAANPDIEIRREYVSGDFNQKLPLYLISNTAAEILWMDDEKSPAYSVRGYLEDLTPYIERDKSELRLDDFLPTTLDAFNYRGVQCGMPWAAVTILVFYNKEVFREAGIPYPEDDWTWDDLRRISKQLTKDLDGDGRFDRFGSNITFGFLPSEPVVWSFGGDMLNEDRTAFALDTPEALRALQFIYDMHRKDHSVAWAGELEGVGEEVQLLTGRVGMVMGGSYLMFLLGSVKGAMDWGMAQVPYGPNGQRFTRVTTEGISINAHTTPEKKEAAWRFIKHVLSSPVQARVGHSGRALPVRRGDVLKYFVRPETPYREEVALESIEFGRLTPVTPKYMELRAAMDREFRSLVIGKTTPEKAVAAMKPAVNEALRKEIEKWGTQGR